MSVIDSFYLYNLGSGNMSVKVNICVAASNI